MAPGDDDGVHFTSHGHLREEIVAVTLSVHVHCLLITQTQQLFASNDNLTRSTYSVRRWRGTCVQDISLTECI